MAESICQTINGHIGVVKGNHLKVSIIVIFMLIMSSIQRSMTINSVLDINGTFPYLINNLTGEIIEPRDYMDFENLFAPNKTYKEKQTAQGRNYHLIKAFDFANYYQSDYWHYSNKDDLIKSAQPVANPSKCSLQLNWLERYLNQSETVLFKPGEQHVNLMTLIDSYGHPETATYYGHGYWLGSYHECNRVFIDMEQFEREECTSVNGDQDARKTCQTTNSDGNHPGDETTNYKEKLKFRYCIGKAHDIDWPKPEQDNYVPRISYKVGICLPETCETTSFQRHSKQIERLMRLNLPEYTRKRIELHDIYCVPDERSPIRALPISAKIYLTICAIWLTSLTMATIIYSFYKRHQQDLRSLMMAERVAVHECTATVNSSTTDVLPNRMDHHHHHHNHPFDTDTSKSRPQLANGGGPLVDCVIVPNCCIEAENKCNNMLANSKLLLKIQTKSSPVALDPTSPVEALVMDCATQDDGQRDLSAYRAISDSSLSSWLNESPIAIKVLQALSIKETLREFSEPPELLRQPEAIKRLRINLNALDSIKCLCCVLVIFGHIIFIHMQHLSNIVHTIELSNEFYPRILIAFFNFVDTFFIISGMLTAYFIFKRFNKRTFANPIVWMYISLLRLLRLSPVYVLVFWFIKTSLVYMGQGPIWDYGTDKNSVKGLCINDHWWKSILYLGNLGTMQPLCILPAWSIIVDAQYSLVVPPIIFLIFRHKRIGYSLLLMATIVSTTKMSFQLANQTAVKTSDMAKIRLHVYPLISRFAAEFYNTAWNRIGPVAIGIVGGHMLYLYDIGSIRRWPWFMRGVPFKVVLFLHVVIFMLPAIGRFVDDPETTNETDMTIFIMSNATIKPIWSLINTIFLLRLITDLRSHSFLARLMSHNIWHCLGKLCFTSYLIHYEVILTFLKSRQDGLIDPNWSNALREFSAVFLISTLISYFIYILFEAPINKLIMLIFAKQRDNLKGSNKQGSKPVDELSDKDSNNAMNSVFKTPGKGIDDSIHCSTKASLSFSKEPIERPDVKYSVIDNDQCTVSTNVNV